MKKFELINSYESSRRYEKLKIYVFSTNEIFNCFDEFFNSEYFKDKFYDIFYSYNAFDVINLSPEERDNIFEDITDTAIRDLVYYYQDMLIIKEFEGR